MAFILAVDFDETLFESSHPNKGKPKRDIINKVKEFKRHNAEVVLWTCREGKSLEEALMRCKEEGLEFDAINSNAPTSLIYLEEQKKKGYVFGTRKIYADFYVDDKAFNLDIFLGLDVKAICNKFAKR
jgi:hypothetical protein